MKETTCPLCGEKVSIADETVYKQHVLCPYCNGKFSYLVDSAEFSSERLAYAIATSQKNSVSNRYYSQAPAGARMYIGLLFYGKVFKDGMDANLYLAAMRKVEPQLKKRDWQYLLENENDPELAAYYKDRMDMAHVGPSSAMSLHVSDYFKADTGTVKAVAMPRKAEPKSDRHIPKQIPIKCPRCGKGIEVDDNVEIGQHISCPYCEGKFSYSKDCIDVPDNKGMEELSSVVAGYDKEKLSRIKSRYDKKMKKRERKKIVTTRVVSYCLFFVSLLVAIVVYFCYQSMVSTHLEIRNALAHYISDNSHILRDWHAQYADVIRECMKDIWIHKDDDAVVEQLKIRVNRCRNMQSDIEKVMHCFSEIAPRLDAMDTKELRLAQSDLSMQIKDLNERVNQFGFSLPVIKASQEIGNTTQYTPIVPEAADPQTSAPTNTPIQFEVSPIREQPKSEAGLPIISEQERLQKKIDGLISKLKELEYGFDPDSLKKYTLQEQRTILEEMLYDAEMLQTKKQNPGH